MSNVFFTEKLTGALHCSFTAAVTHVQLPKADVGYHSCTVINSFLAIMQANFLLCDELSKEVSVSAMTLAKVVLGEESTAMVSKEVKESNQIWDNEKNGHGVVQEGRH